MSSNGLIYTKFCMFSLYGRWALPFPSPDSMTHVHPLSEQGLNQLWRHQERIKCNTAAMPTPWDVRENTDSTWSFSRQLLTWDKQRKISQFNHGNATHLSKNIFFKIQLPPTFLSPAGWQYLWGWLGSRRPSIPIRLSQVSTFTLRSCSELLCVLLKRHWLQFRRVSSEQVQCQIVLKTFPFHLLSGYCTQMNRGFLSLETILEHKMQEKHRRHQQPEAPITQGTGMPKTSRELSYSQLLGDR